MPADSIDSIAALVAIFRAAHLSKDRALERVARRKLAEVYGVDVTFRRGAIAASQAATPTGATP